MQRTLRIGWQHYDELEEVGEQLLREPMSAADFKCVLARLAPLPRGHPISRTLTAPAGESDETQMHPMMRLCFRCVECCKANAGAGERHRS